MHGQGEAQIKKTPLTARKPPTPVKSNFPAPVPLRPLILNFHLNLRASRAPTMAKNSKIQWTTHTFNGWRGCTKVSPGCKHCYAEKLVTTRLQGEWGPGAPRQLASDAMWREPLKWDKEAARDLHEFTTTGAITDESGAVIATTYERPRVFCSSLADVFDHEVPIEWRVRLFDLIAATPNLDWLLLTKRPESWSARLHEAASASPFALRWLNGEAPANIWMGTSVEDQQRADERIPELLSIPARVRFLSCEPLLGPVDLAFGHPKWRTAESYHAYIHWVIVGGESGPDARPMHVEWARSLRDQCAAAGVPFLFKQWGEWVPWARGVEYPKGTTSDFVMRNGSKYAPGNFTSPCQSVMRVGKKAAGRLLDGVEHNGYPTA